MNFVYVAKYYSIQIMQTGEKQLYMLEYRETKSMGLPSVLSYFISNLTCSSYAGIVCNEAVHS